MHMCIFLLHAYIKKISKFEETLIDIYTGLAYKQTMTYGLLTSTASHMSML